MTKSSKTTQPEIDYFGVFSNSFRKHVHLLIMWGHSDAHCRIESINEEEPSITGYIASSIKNRLRDINCPSWCKYYFVQDDPPVESEGRVGKRRRRADIIIESNVKGRPEFVFEAKRLRQNGYGVSKYVGSDGIGCFINGVYGSRYNETAMLGYIQSDSLNHWKSKIKETIDNNNANLELISAQQEITVIDEIQFEWFSEHARKAIGRPIKIYHILLDCIC
jgi:hypothetical protein